MNYSKTLGNVLSLFSLSHRSASLILFGDLDVSGSELYDALYEGGTLGTESHLRLAKYILSQTEDPDYAKKVMMDLQLKAREAYISKMIEKSREDWPWPVKINTI